MNKKDSKVELTLPFKAEYVSVARLTASAVSNRMGFDIESIEDIKVALAEVCNKLVACDSSNCDNYKITFIIRDKELSIIFNSEGKSFYSLFGGEDSELGVSIIQALMDEINVPEDNLYILSMTKTLEGDKE